MISLMSNHCEKFADKLNFYINSTIFTYNLHIKTVKTRKHHKAQTRGTFKLASQYSYNTSILRLANW